MDGILVFAKVKGGKQFIGTFSDMDNLHDEVDETLAMINRQDLTDDIYFLANGEEYKLYIISGMDK